MRRETSIRPLTRADAAQVQAFVRRLSPQARLERYFSPIRELAPRQLERATGGGEGVVNLGVFAPGATLVALGQCVAAGEEAEFGVVVADAWQGSGIGRLLLEALTDAARQQGLVTLYGVVRRGNTAMLALARRLGFDLVRDPDPALLRVARPLRTAGVGYRGRGIFPDPGLGDERRFGL